MARLMLPALASALALFSSAWAFDKIRIADTVSAGEETTVTITNDLDDGSDSFDAGFEKYRLYLSTSPPGWGWGPSCYLVNSSAIDVTSLKVAIPASVVPDGTDLMVTTMEFNDDPNLDGPSGFEYSNEFTLDGGTGTWSQAELAGTTLADADNVPCTALKCARDCNEKWYPENMDDANWDTAVKSTYECIAACPGVTYPSWNEINGGSGSTTASGVSTQTTAVFSAPFRPSPGSQIASTTSLSSATTTASDTPSGSTTTAGTSTAATTTSGTPSATPNAASKLSSTALTLISICAILLAII